MSTDLSIFTIGHSTHDFSHFVKLLKRHGITAVADVRSHPHSRLDHFCRPSLESGLRLEAILYVFLGRELGARRDEPECYIDDRADYSRIARLPAFSSGLERLERGAKSHAIALLCAEKDPLDCHRMILICRQLAQRGWTIAHILEDGGLESHAAAEQRLVRRTGAARTLFEPDLSEAEVIQQAYDLRAIQIAYRRVNEPEGAVE